MPYLLCVYRLIAILRMKAQTGMNARFGISTSLKLWLGLSGALHAPFTR